MADTLDRVEMKILRIDFILANEILVDLVKLMIFVESILVTRNLVKNWVCSLKVK